MTLGSCSLGYVSPLLSWNAFPKGKESREIKDVCHQKNPARRLPPEATPWATPGHVSLSLVPPRPEVPQLCPVPETVFLHGCGNTSIGHIYSNLSHFLESIKSSHEQDP